VIDRRGFFARALGGVVAAVVGPRLAVGGAAGEPSGPPVFYWGGQVIPFKIDADLPAREFHILRRQLVRLYQRRNVSRDAHGNAYVTEWLR
jgi:hypothetical protein